MGGQFDIDNPPPASDESVDLQDTGDWGVDFGIYRDHTSFYEILYSYQSAGLDTSNPSLKGVDVAIQYLQVGGTLLFHDHEHFVPYLSLTVGATKFDAGGGYGSETKFSGSLGGGFRLPVGEHFAATLGLRGYLTAVESDTRVLLQRQRQRELPVQDHGQHVLPGRGAARIHRHVLSGAAAQTSTRSMPPSFARRT